MIKASLGVSLPVVIVTAVMFFTGEPITSFERKLAGYILVPSLIIFVWSFLSMLIDFCLKIFIPNSRCWHKSQFMARFVTDGHKNEPIYDTIDQVLNEKKEGAFAARVVGCAAEAPLNWLKAIPSSREMVLYFGLDAIHSETSFNGGLSKFRKDAFKEGSNATTINIMKDKLEQLKNEIINEKKKDKTRQ